MSMRGLDTATYAAAPKVLAELAELNAPHKAALAVIADGGTATFVMNFITFVGKRTVPIEVVVVLDHTATDADATKVWAAQGGGSYLRWELKDGQVGVVPGAEIDLRQNHT